MRKLNARTVLFGMLVTISLCSYLYLSSVSIDGQNQNIEEAGQIEEIEGDPSDMILPDVQLIKKVLETGKRLIPAT